MKETMLTYIQEEPIVLTKILTEFDDIGLANILPNNLNRILILATGSSMNAAVSTKYFIEKISKVIVSIEEPFNFQHYGTVDTDIDLIIAISQGGTSTSTINTVSDLSIYDIPIIVITNNMESPLNKYASYTLNLNIGEEKIGYVTKGFSGTLLNLQLLTLTIGLKYKHISEEVAEKNKDDIKKIIKKIPLVTDKAIDYFEHNKDKFIDNTRYSCIGYGANYGIAKEFETKFSETVRLPSSGFELEAYMHGPFLEAQKNHLLIFLINENNIANRSCVLRDYMEKYVGDVITIASSNIYDCDLNIDYKEGNELLLPLLYVIPIQVWSYLTSLDKSSILTKNKFDDFDKKLNSKLKNGGI